MNPFSPSDVNMGNVASAEDYARYGALADIAGIQDPMLKQENIGQAGTAPKFSVDQQRLGQDLGAAKSKYMNDYKTLRGFAEGTSGLGGNEGVNPAIRNMTIEELENYLPTMFAEGGLGASTATNIKNKIDAWKAEQGYNNKVLSLLDKAGDTSDGKVHAWI